VALTPNDSALKPPAVGQRQRRVNVSSSSPGAQAHFPLNVRAGRLQAPVMRRPRCVRTAPLPVDSARGHQPETRLPLPGAPTARAERGGLGRTASRGPRGAAERFPGQRKRPRLGLRGAANSSAARKQGARWATSEILLRSTYRFIQLWVAPYNGQRLSCRLWLAAASAERSFVLAKRPSALPSERTRRAASSAG
jgi:hypothetical protein